MSDPTDLRATESSPLAATRERGPVTTLLDEIWTEAASRDGGELASYIPQLALADPTVFGLTLATLDGQVYTAGPIAPFTIQSVSKPFAYALALADRGLDLVLGRVGVEPTGNAFNTISVDEAGRPFNPMVNAGAIVTTSLLNGDTRAEQFERVHAGLCAFAGRSLEIDEQVFASERETGARNRAIGYLLRSVNGLDEDVEGVLDTYFRQCAIVVTARDLAVMSATLANAGVNPVTGESVVEPAVVSRVLTVMSTCGMYDFAGEWLYRVGLPAKSGVSGGIAAVHPGRLGIGAHSPLLDPRGNSVRGIAACELLSARLGLHLFAGAASDGAWGSRQVRGDVVRSKRVRRAVEREVLDKLGSRILVSRLSGSQDVAATEQAVRSVIVATEPAVFHVLDLSRVHHVESASVVLLAGLVAQLDEEGAAVAVVLPRSMLVRRNLGTLIDVATVQMTDPDAALQWCEDALLGDAGVLTGPSESLLPVAELDLLKGLTPGAISAIEAAMVTRVYAAGSNVFTEGAPADGLYFVAAGQVSAMLRSDGKSRRLSTMGPGSSFGELALLDGSPRSVSVVADIPTLCHLLTAESLATLVEADPTAGIELHRALAQSLAVRLRQATTEITVLDTV